MKNLVENLADLAMEIEKECPIDFGYLSIDERETYLLVASQILEMYLASDKEFRDEVMLASCIKLAVENFVLHTKLRITNI